VDCWSEILRRTRRTRLMLKSFDLADEETAERLTGDFAARGVERERLTLLKPARTTREHLSAYRRADVALDTHPYSGTVTTLEALLMGVPVVTRGEGRHVSRVTRSILKATGMGQWVAGSREEYVEAAVRAAERRDVSRAAVRRRFLNSPVCDGPGYARRMEALYRLL